MKKLIAAALLALLATAAGAAEVEPHSAIGYPVTTTGPAPRSIPETGDNGLLDPSLLPAGGGSSGANPTATAGPTANNGVAATFMRSDASPAVQLGSSGQAGLLQCGAAMSCSAGVISESAGISHPGYVAGDWYLPVGNDSSSANSVATVVGTAYCTPGRVMQSLTVEGLGAFVATVSAGGNLQLAIYNNSATHRPGTLVANTGSISTTTSAAVSAAVVQGSGSVSLGAGIYWWCIQQDNTTSLYRALALNDEPPVAMIGSATLGHVLGQSGVWLEAVSTTAPGTFGTWPDLTSATFTDATSGAAAPIVAFQVLSTP